MRVPHRLVAILPSSTTVVTAPLPAAAPAGAAVRAAPPAVGPAGPAAVGPARWRRRPASPRRRGDGMGLAGAAHGGTAVLADRSRPAARGERGEHPAGDLVRRAVGVDDDVAVRLGGGHPGEQPPDPQVLLAGQRDRAGRRRPGRPPRQCGRAVEQHRDVRAAAGRWRTRPGSPARRRPARPASGRPPPRTAPAGWPGTGRRRPRAPAASAGRTTRSTWSAARRGLGQRPRPRARQRRFPSAAPALGPQLRRTGHDHRCPRSRSAPASRCGLLGGLLGAWRPRPRSATRSPRAARPGAARRAGRAASARCAGRPSGGRRACRRPRRRGRPPA